MTELEKLEEKLRILQEEHKSAWEKYGSELSAGSLIAEEEKLQKQIDLLKEKEDDAVWKMYAEAHEIKSGKAYEHLFKNHTHPLGDKGEDMVTFEVALQAIKIAEDNDKT
jgi:hypothetical protein